MGTSHVVTLSCMSFPHLHNRPVMTKLFHKMKDYPVPLNLRDVEEMDVDICAVQPQVAEVRYRSVFKGWYFGYIVWCTFWDQGTKTSMFVSYIAMAT